TRSSPPTPPCPASGSSPPPPRCSARPSTCSASATASAPRSQKPVQHHPETPGKRPCTRITRGNFGLARAFGGDGLGDLAGGALERGHDAGGGLVGHPRLRTGGGDGQRTRRVRHGRREAADANLLLALV